MDNNPTAFDYKKKQDGLEKFDGEVLFVMKKLYDASELDNICKITICLNENEWSLIPIEIMSIKAKQTMC